MTGDGVGKRKAEPDVVAACSNDVAKKQYQGDADRKGKDENEPPRNNVVDLTLQDEDEDVPVVGKASGTAIFSDEVSNKTHQSEDQVEKEGDEDDEKGDDEDDEEEDDEDDEEGGDDDNDADDYDNYDTSRGGRVNVHDLYNGHSFMKESEMNAKQLKRYKAYQALVEEDGNDYDEEWDEYVQFKPKIIDPKASRLDPDGSAMKGFTVWTLEKGKYDCSGKRFDSTWNTKDDANERARYLCYWKNPWGWEPQYVEEDAREQELHGLYKYTADPENQSTWTAAVVPDEAFETPMHW